MAHLAQNQLDFQQYNQQLKGPSSPVDMETLKKNAKNESIKQAALGKVFDSATSSYIDSDTKVVEVSQAPAQQQPSVLGKRDTDKALINPFKKARYEVYTDTPIADEFGNKMTRVVEMGIESWDTAGKARDVADRLRAKGMKTYVFRVNRCPVKNRKNIKRQGKPRVKKTKTQLKSVSEFSDRVDFGDWKGLPGTMKAKGKQQTWWIPRSTQLNGTTTNETIRNCVLSMKRVQASVLVNWIEEKAATINPSVKIRLSEFLADIPYHANGQTEKAKVRQLTMRLRKICGRYSHKSYLSNLTISSDMLPSAPVAGASSHGVLSNP